MDASDAPLWFELDQDPEVMRYLNDGQPSTWDDITRYFTPRVAGFTKAEQGHGLWEVAANTTGDYLGWILVREYGIGTAYHESDNLELGWRFKRHSWGLGIATEAARSVMRAVLQASPGIRAVCAIADPQNIASIAVMQKLGMRYVDERVHHTPRRDFVCAYYEMPVGVQVAATDSVSAKENF
jgi:RimJ/RimL family protein N-acetyltransferase